MSKGCVYSASQYDSEEAVMGFYQLRIKKKDKTNVLSVRHCVSCNGCPFCNYREM